MRDILVVLLVFGALPFILYRPFFGVVVWTWMSLMNPHRLAWGFATTWPLAMIVAVTLLVSYLISKEPKKLPMTREVIVVMLFVVWMLTTTFYSIRPDMAWVQWDKVWRIQLMIAVTIMLTTSRMRIHVLVWTICVSLGFYSFKGGIWVLMTGGVHQVYGPPNTFIGGNNELGLALIMIVPLLWYLILQTKRLWARWGLYAALAFTLIAIVGTHSRGALVGLAAMGLMFFLKARRKFVPLIASAIFIVLLPNIMPEHWFERMHTIETYQEDKSATERIRAWKNAIALAGDRFMGGGYDALIYYGGRDAHSIYFEVLGEHGYPGLALFLLLGWLTWRKCAAIKRLSRRNRERRWAFDLAAMLQVSLIGYASAGAFLGLAYFDLYYVLIAATIATHCLLRSEETVERGVAHPPIPAPTPGTMQGGPWGRAQYRG